MHVLIIISFIPLLHHCITFVSLSVLLDPWAEPARPDSVEARLDLSPLAFLAGPLFLAFFTPRPPPKKSALLHELCVSK